ncbi:phage holin family protein [Amycolatopsis thermoflava]|uniref:phage holin family protein n=1 Tax=Amycolatopsis thermoflava TaxID=84480 RepID=UPI003EBADF53
MTQRRADDIGAEFGAKIGDLVRRELRVAAREMREKARFGGLGMVLLTVAAVCGLYAGGLVVAGLVQLLSRVLPGWLAAACVAGVLSLIAAVAGVEGLGQLRAAMPPVPERAAVDAAEAAGAAHSAVAGDPESEPR